jgi:hypothetical protein
MALEEKVRPSSDRLASRHHPFTMLLLLSQQSTDMEEAAERRDRDNEMQTEIDGLRESLKQLKAQRPHPDRAAEGSLDLRGLCKSRETRRSRKPQKMLGRLRRRHKPERERRCRSLSPFLEAGRSLSYPFVHLSQQLAETQHQEEMGRLRQELQVASKVQRPTEQTDFFVGFAKGWASYDH